MPHEKLKKIRQQEKLTYEQVANQVGISKEHYWYIENGQRRLNYDTAVKIAKVFKSTPDYIFLDYELTKSEQNGDSKQEVNS